LPLLYGALNIFFHYASGIVVLGLLNALKIRVLKQKLKVDETVINILQKVRFINVLNTPFLICIIVCNNEKHLAVLLFC
jgi:hypothetical protein